jgi:hypothetical protein
VVREQASERFDVAEPAQLVVQMGARASAGELAANGRAQLVQPPIDDACGAERGGPALDEG